MVSCVNTLNALPSNDNNDKLFNSHHQIRYLNRPKISHRPARLPIIFKRRNIKW